MAGIFGYKPIEIYQKLGPNLFIWMFFCILSFLAIFLILWFLLIFIGKKQDFWRLKKKMNKDKLNGFVGGGIEVDKFKKLIKDMHRGFPNWTYQEMVEKVVITKN